MNFRILRVFLPILVLLATAPGASAQVNAVEFGRNRVQYQDFNWKYYQTPNFNTYFSQDGLEIGKYVAQVAEGELGGLEKFVEYGVQRRINILVYNNYDEFQQSNVGLGIDWQNSGGVTKLVNNKMLVFFDGNRNNLKRQIRQGIAGVLVQNLLFGDDLGEMAANQTLLDLPKWLTDGYIAYAGERWNTALDDELKSELLSGDYRNFYQFAHYKPLLAGHAFWYYFGNKYGESKNTYLLYLSRIYRNLNGASTRIAKKKFKNVLTDFMTEMSQQYFKDIRGRRVMPKGQLAVTEEIGKRDYIRFNANPVPRSFTYAVVEFKQGKYSVVLNENFVNRKILLTYGTRSREDEINPNYPILAWDGKGSRLLVVYNEEGKTKMFVWDNLNRIKILKRELPQFDQVQDAKYMLDANTLLFSAVKGGQTDIFVYKIDKGTTEQITNDVYDDLDASFVSFPGRTGILFSSNRPSAQSISSDTSMPAPNFNIYLVDNWNKSEFKQISRLSNLGFGNARFPSQYNTYHFTFASDENGINNRYAGFFTTEAAGLDTLVFIEDEVLRNPPQNEVDSLLKEYGKTDVDSVGFMAVSKDSSYVFPLTNYQASLRETRTAGDNSLVSETVRQGDYKFLYRLKVDENALRRRNVNAKPTDFVRRLRAERQNAADSTAGEGEDMPSDGGSFETGFESDTTTSSSGAPIPGATPAAEPTLLERAKLFTYRPRKFFNDYLVAGLNNTVFGIARYQPYAGGSGPIRPANGNNLNGIVRLGTLDLMEDIKISGGFRIAGNLRDNDILFEFTNQRRRLDWGASFFRSTQGVGFEGTPITGKLVSTYALARLKYPLDRVRSIRLTVGPRFDNTIIIPNYRVGSSLSVEDQKVMYGQITAEYVHDNTLNPAQNIWNGLRYKVYTDFFSQLRESGPPRNGKTLFNVGFDARHYLPIYRNVIWAVRAAGDFSWGTQKTIYYLGGTDGWLMLGANSNPGKFFNENPRPAPDQTYAFQTLAVNLRGFKQNVANGNNNFVINSEVRMPVFSTLLNRPINNAFLRNFQLVQFFDLGSAWNGKYDGIKRPSQTFANPNPQPGNSVVVNLNAGGIGPFAGGYGFGARSTLLGYFVRYDAAWQMNTFFKGKPQMYLSLGLDF